MLGCPAVRSCYSARAERTHMHDLNHHSSVLAGARRHASVRVLAVAIAWSPILGCNMIVGIEEPYDRDSESDASMSDHETPEDDALSSDVSTSFDTGAPMSSDSASTELDGDALAERRARSDASPDGANDGASSCE